MSDRGDQGWHVHLTHDHALVPGGAVRTRLYNLLYSCVACRDFKEVPQGKDLEREFCMMSKAMNTEVSIVCAVRVV